MRKGVAGAGVFLLILGLILAVVLYPLVGYDTADDCADDLKSEFSGLSGLVSGTLGKDVEFTGKVNEVWTDEVPFIDVAFDLIGLSVITIEDLEIEVSVMGLYDDVVPIIVFADNTDLSSGDDVFVDGYAFGSSNLGVIVIIGDSGVEVAFNLLTTTTPPDPASVEILPRAGFYVGAIIAFIGLIVLIAGFVAKARTTQPVQYQYGTQYLGATGTYPNLHNIAPPVGPRRTPPPPPIAKPVDDEYNEEDDEDEDEYEDDDEEFGEVTWEAENDTKKRTPPPPAAYRARFTVGPTQPAYSSGGQQYPCRSCGQSLTFVYEYQRWYCYSCQRYA